jgi:hypothetical protein
MGITFPRESAAYRADRDRLLAHEIELRRAMEAVAVERRALSPGGIIPEDYVFQRGGVDGAPVDVRLSELFARAETRSWFTVRCTRARRMTSDQPRLLRRDRRTQAVIGEGAVITGAVPGAPQSRRIEARP